MASHELAAARQTTVAIIGSGPAGCATAKSFLDAMAKPPMSNASAHISIFDANRQTNTSLGESIPPAATQAMQELGVAEAVIKSRHLMCPGSISIWGSDTPGYNDFYHFPMGQGYHLDRELFNRQLVASVDRPEVNLHQGYALTSARQISSGFELKFRHGNGKKCTVPVNYVVDASGIGSVFSRRINVVKNVLDQVISLCVTLEDVPADTIDRRTLVEAVTDGWWYAALLPDRKLILSFCSDQGTLKSSGYEDIRNWKQLLSRTRLIADKIPLSLISEDLTIIKRVAPTSILSRVVGKNWLAVGDAASSYDSISSAGITKALQHGIHAGKALCNAIKGGSDKPFLEYQNIVFDEFNRYAQLRHDIYRSEKRFKHKRFWMNRFNQ